PLGHGYFRPLAEHPTLAQALWATVRELRMAGLRSDQLDADIFASPAKHLEIVGLLGAYQRFLDEHGRADMATVVWEALHHLDWCPIQPQDCWTELPDANWSPLQRALLESMPGERVKPHTLRLPGIALPRRLTRIPTERVNPEATTNPLAFLMKPAEPNAQ